MQNLLFVAAGGAMGASLRYGAGLAASRLLGSAFPWGTFLVNLVGCFVMGLVGQWLLNFEPQAVAGAAALAKSSTIRHLVAIGFLGGLTTFSAFSWDTLQEIESGRLNVALLNAAANLLLCLLAVWAGATLVRAAS